MCSQLRADHGVSCVTTVAVGLQLLGTTRSRRGCRPDEDASKAWNPRLPQTPYDRLRSTGWIGPLRRSDESPAKLRDGACNPGRVE